jgi:hypothetical protein
MLHNKALFLAMVTLVLGAGITLGKLSNRLMPAATPPKEDRTPDWKRVLQLTTEQQQQMDAIWADARQKVGKTFDQRRALDKERDQAIQNLLTPDQKVAYEQIQEDNRAKRQDLDQQREACIHDAEDHSRALLTDEQRQRWDSWPKGPNRGGGDRDHRGPRGPGGGPGFGPGRPGGFGGGPRNRQATSRPTTQSSEDRRSVPGVNPN